MSAGGRSTGAWAVLALALAVPALLFYGWWSRMDAAKKKELNRKIRDRGVGAFSTSGRNKDKLANPITEVPEGGAPEGAAAVPASTEAVTAAPVQPEGASQPGQPPAPPPEGLAQPAPADPSQQAAQPQPGADGADVAASSLTARYFMAASGIPSRDPMLSPYELIKMQREELERRLNERAIKEVIAVPGKPPRRRVEAMPNVELQGIISTADGGFQAIVNDNLVRQGDSVAGGKIKVLKISASAVVFSWKSKRFTRSVNQ